MENIWKDVPEFEGIEVSVLGEVRKKQPDGSLTELHQSLDRGYLKVSFTHNKKRLTPMVHTLVMLAFNTSFVKGCDKISHTDGNRQNNKLSNLKYVSQSTIYKNTSKNKKGPNNQGSRNNKSKLNEDQVAEILRSYSKRRGEIKELAMKYQVSPITISSILSGNTWSHVPRP